MDSGFLVLGGILKDNHNTRRYPTPIFSFHQENPSIKNQCSNKESESLNHGLDGFIDFTVSFWQIREISVIKINP